MSRRASTWTRVLAWLWLGTGCIHLSPPDTVAHGRSVIPGTQCSIEMPAGWTWVEAKSDRLMASHDGIDLACIEVVSSPIAEAFLGVRNKTADDLDADKLADLSLADTKARGAKDGAGAVEVVESRVETFSGERGFLTHMRIASRSGLSYDHLQADFIHAGRVIRIHYQAPSIHYFARDRQAFDRALASIEFR
jgi:hypothetical protein